MTRAINAARFILERLLLRGSVARLALMALAVLLVSVGGGLALVVVGADESVSEAVWWAFLRLTDPGYLGDDEGTARRVVSTALTVAGYVLFMGALIAILTQALQETIAKLQRGETPIVASGHLLILGNTSRTPIVIAELLRSEARVQRFLARVGRRRRVLIVALVDHLNEQVRAKLKAEVGDLWDDRDIILRSGSPLEGEHLERVDFANAAAILIPGGQGESTAELRDATVIKTLLSIARHPAVTKARKPPRLVAELADARLVDVVRPPYRGELTLVPSDAIVSQLIVQNVRHRGLSWVLAELLNYNHGADLYFHDLPSLAGLRFHEAAARIRAGVALGFVRPTGASVQVFLNPPSDARFEKGDRMVVVAREYADIAPLAAPRSPVFAGTVTPIEVSLRAARKLLVLGWSDRLISVLRELETYTRESYDVLIVSTRPVAQREELLARSGVALSRVKVRHQIGDYTNVHDVRALDLRAFDNLLITGRAYLDGGEQSDAQTLIAHLIVRDCLRDPGPRPSVLVELMDPANVPLYEDVPGEVVLSPAVMGRLLGHIALRSELAAVLAELFTAGGAEFYYRNPADYGLSDGTMTFAELSMVAASHGELLVGVRVSDTGLDVRSDVSVAPAPGASFQVGACTRLVVIVTLPT